MDHVVILSFCLGDNCRWDTCDLDPARNSAHVTTIDGVMRPGHGLNDAADPHLPLTAVWASESGTPVLSPTMSATAVIMSAPNLTLPATEREGTRHP